MEILPFAVTESSSSPSSSLLSSSSSLLLVSSSNNTHRSPEGIERLSLSRTIVSSPAPAVQQQVQASGFILPHSYSPTASSSTASRILRSINNGSSVFHNDDNSNIINNNHHYHHHPNFPLLSSNSSSLVTASSHEGGGARSSTTNDSEYNIVPDDSFDDDNISSSNSLIITTSVTSNIDDYSNTLITKTLHPTTTKACSVRTYQTTIPSPLQHEQQPNRRRTEKATTTTSASSDQNWVPINPTIVVIPPLPYQQQQQPITTTTTKYQLHQTDRPSNQQKFAGQSNTNNIESSRINISVTSRVSTMFTNFTARYTGSGGGGNATSTSTSRSTPDTLSRTTKNDITATPNRDKGQRITMSPMSSSSLIEDDGEEIDIVSSPETTASSDAIDFAYVNVTDEDEVDVWVDGTNNYPYYTNRKGGGGIETGFLFSSNNPNGTIDGSRPVPKNTAADILTILISGSIQQNTHPQSHHPQQQHAGTSNTSNDSSKRIDSLQDVSQQTTTTSEKMIQLIEDGNRSSMEAAEAKLSGNIQHAFQKHTDAAKLFHNAALLLVKDHSNGPMMNSLLLLSQSQAKSALALKRVLKIQPKGLARLESRNSNNSNSSNANSGQVVGETGSTKAEVVTQGDRLRATLRGALDTHHQPEADITESVFLGKATTNSEPLVSLPKQTNATTVNTTTTSLITQAKESPTNPVDEIMELERALRDMNMALEMSNSIASVSTQKTRGNGSMKNSISDGSFMVVPAGSNSYMSSSVMWGTALSNPSPPAPFAGQHHPTPGSSRPASNSSNNFYPSAKVSGAGNARARANRVQSVGTRPSSAVNAAQHQQLIVPGNKLHQQQQQSHTQASANHGTSSGGGLESSWWGNASTISSSQMMSASGILLAPVVDSGSTSNSSNNTKQLMRLMDSLKTLSDENAALTREVKEAEAARLEAKAANEEMKRFKKEYEKRFASLKEALEKFRKSFPTADSTSDGGDVIVNPVATSEYIRSASVAEQIQRQEQLIRKLTLDLRKEKEESKKKDAQLEKYEKFYKEVKARSAQKRQQMVMESTAKATPRQTPGVPMGYQHHPSTVNNVSSPNTMSRTGQGATPLSPGYRAPRP